MPRLPRITSADMPEPLTAREADILRLVVAGLSNREIGVQLFLTEGTVKWHNQHIFAKLAVRSRAEAIAKAHQLRLFHQPIIPTADKPRSNLPIQPTTFIGREQELADIVERIRQPDCRLLTLIGAGGSGKTRLAVQTGTHMLLGLRDGVFFTPLEPISSPDQVTAAMAQACRLHFQKGVDPHQQVIDFLQHKEALLILDNFEHLLDARDVVLNVLEQTHRLKILITSRVALHLSAEWVLMVGGMAFPQQKAADEVQEFDAIRLFIDCARRSGRTLVPQRDLPHIAHICQLTQGLPLAIKLAASWLRTLTCPEIAQALTDNADLLATPLHDLPERHQSMRRVFQQSWHLLTDAERKILSAFSIFRGGFTSAASREVAGASLTDLARLIDQSWVQTTGDGRYDLHPLIAQYLDEQLEASGEKLRIREAHAAYYTEFLHTRRRDLMGGRQLAALNEVETDFENVSAAWQWLIDQQDYTQIEIAWEPLLLYTNVRGGESVFAHLRKLPLTVEKPHRVMAYLHWLLPGRTEEDVQRALVIAEQHQDVRARAFALRELGMMIADSNTSVATLSQSLALFRNLGEGFYIADLLLLIGWHYSILGERTKLNDVDEECLRLSRSIDDQLSVAHCLHDMASIWFFDGEYARAEPVVREALTINQEFGNRINALFCTQFLGHLHLLPGSFDAAAQLYHTALALAEDAGGHWRQGFAYLLAFLANAEGNYLEADAHCDRSRVAFSYHPFIIMGVNWAQSVAHCGLGRYQTAREYVSASLRFAFQMDSICFMALCLPPAALILWNDNQKELAVEMIALAFSHPKSQEGWFVKSPLGEHAVEDMKADMGETRFEAAWQKGVRRDLHATTTELLALLEG